MDSALLSTLRHGLLGKSKRNHIHVHSLYAPLRQLELMYLRMSEERTPLIRLHEHAFAVQIYTVLVLIFAGYDFVEGHEE